MFKWCLLVSYLIFVHFGTPSNYFGLFLVHQRVHRFETIANIGQNFALSMLKSTLPPVKSFIVKSFFIINSPLLLQPVNFFSRSTIISIVYFCSEKANTGLHFKYTPHHCQRHLHSTNPLFLDQKLKNPASSFTSKSIWTHFSGFYLISAPLYNVKSKRKTLRFALHLDTNTKLIVIHTFENICTQLKTCR